MGLLASTLSTKKFLWVRILLSLIIFATSFLLGYYYGFNKDGINLIFKTQDEINTQYRDLVRYSIPSLSSYEFDNGNLLIKEAFYENDEYSSHIFEFAFKPDPESDDIKKTSGQINFPKTTSKNYPVILMLRGYVDQSIYETGIGTRSAAAYFAKNGFITIAPDFLGYAESDSEAGNIFESRFQTYTTASTLLTTLENIKTNQKLISGPDQLISRLVNYPSMFIWGHSNGGHIALAVLEISGENYPTTLWAPVSAAFPYSVLYYTSESLDGGKLIRGELNKLEDLINTDLFSTTEYLDQIHASIQVHQGTADDAVPVEWSDSLVNKLKALDLEVSYFKYPGADHNLRPDWDTVVERDLEFFSSFLDKSDP